MKFNVGDRVRVVSNPPISFTVNHPDAHEYLDNATLCSGICGVIKAYEPSSVLYTIFLDRKYVTKWGYAWDMTWVAEEWIEPENATAPSVAQAAASLKAIRAEEQPISFVTPFEKRDFEGFCNPCGGFRKHRLGCPVS